MNVFSERLSALIKKPLTQQIVADAVGVEQPTVQRWLKGNAQPRGEELLKLAAFLEVDPYTLMFEERPLPVSVFREIPSEALVDDALHEMEELKEKVQALNRALLRIKQKNRSKISSGVTSSAARAGLQASQSAASDPAE